MSDYNYALLSIVLGIFTTLKYSIFSTIFGLILGIVLAFGKISKLRIAQWLVSGYISLFRGTPLLLQLSLFYFVLPVLIKVDMGVTLTGIICFSLNSAAYIAEVIRSGIVSVDRGQFEAAQSLNIPKFKEYKDIILPQVARNIFPGIVNEMINLIKESSIISVVGEIDIMRRSQLVAAEYYTYLPPLLVAGICYYALILAVSAFGRWCENKINVYDKI